MKGNWGASTAIVGSLWCVGVPLVGQSHEKRLPPCHQRLRLSVMERMYVSVTCSTRGEPSSICWSARLRGCPVMKSTVFC